MRHSQRHLGSGALAGSVAGAFAGRSAHRSCGPRHAGGRGFCLPQGGQPDAALLKFPTSSSLPVARRMHSRVRGGEAELLVSGLRGLRRVFRGWSGYRKAGEQSANPGFGASCSLDVAPVPCAILALVWCRPLRISACIQRPIRALLEAVGMPNDSKARKPCIIFVLFGNSRLSVSVRISAIDSRTGAGGRPNLGERVKGNTGHE